MSSEKYEFFLASPSLNLWPIDMFPKNLWQFFHCGKLQNSVHHKAYKQLKGLDPVVAIMAENT